MPNDDFILSLIQRCGKPLLVTSANLSGYPSAADAEEVLAQLDGRIDGIVVGEAGGHQASTIIDVSGEDYRILRQGIVENPFVIYSATCSLFGSMSVIAPGMNASANRTARSFT